MAVSVAPMRNNKEWLVPLTGVAFVVVVILSFVFGGEPPDHEDPVREIVDHYVDNKDAIEIGAVLSTLAGAFLVFFFGYVRKILRAAEGPGGMLSLVAFAGAVIIALGAAIDSTLAFAIAEAADDIDPTATQALQAFWDNDFLPFALGGLLLQLATGISIVRHGALPKWLGWVAIVLGIVSLTPVGFFAFLVTAVWILVVSVLLARRARAVPTTAPPGQPPPAAPAV